MPRSTRVVIIALPAMLAGAWAFLAFVTIGFTDTLARGAADLIERTSLAEFFFVIPLATIAFVLGGLWSTRLGRICCALLIGLAIPMTLAYAEIYADTNPPCPSEAGCTYAPGFNAPLTAMLFAVPGLLMAIPLVLAWWRTRGSSKAV